MSLMKNNQESEIRQRYKNIIDQKVDWESDVNHFLYDALTEVRKKISLINMAMYKSRIFLVIPFVIFGIAGLIGGIISAKFFKLMSFFILGFGSLFLIISLCIVLLILFKKITTKSRLKYLDATIKKINSKTTITYNKDLEKLIQLFIADGRSGMIAGAATRPGNYYVPPGDNNMNNINNMGMMGMYTPPMYNPILGQQINDIVVLSDLFQEIDWEKMFRLYNSVYR